MKKPLTLEQFIKRAKKIHGTKYDYSKVVFISTRIDVIIICPFHGEFNQKPCNHLNGAGCTLCRNHKAKIDNLFTSEQFIEKAKNIHGERYNYSKVIYFGKRYRVIIICKKHGDFLQFPSNHLNGAGCAKCAREHYAKNHPTKYSLEEFIAKAKKVHGDKYSYRKIVYNGIFSKVIITCQVHGDFEQAASDHIRGRGCSKCSNELIRSTTEEFITKAKEVHGDKYDYSEVEYITSTIPLKIVCKKHGAFRQKPSSHLQGQGCSVCRSSKGELLIKAILDKHDIKHIQEYSIPEVVANYCYDFYLPEYNLLIEFQGIQHYEYIPFFHRTEDGFLAQKNRDDIKKYNAKQYKYKYVEFNYKQHNILTIDEFEKIVLKSIRNNKRSFDIL